jgi:selenocysteine-specific elongation factor
MYVVATAGHVDHGKSTLVRALTGMEPDRWAEERRRGMTIDLGYAWTRLPSGADLAFVDVPGHERFIGNMLAGVGPAPAVLFVVAADGGWNRQSSEHLAAIDALGIEHGLLAVTRSDLADPSAATAEARERLARSSLGTVESVAVSGATGFGLPLLRDALQRMVERLPPPETQDRLRLWVDRVFTIRGSGTVVTGTLGSGRVAVGDQLVLSSSGGPRRVTVRGLETLRRSVAEVDAVARVAVNLRGLSVADAGRGDALLSVAGWRLADQLDVRLDGAAADRPEQLVLHAGTAAVPVRLRPLGGSVARLRLSRPLPVQVGDRAILRDPGRRTIVAGVRVLDAAPPALSRRGAAARRAAVLDRAADAPDIAGEVLRRGSVRREELAALGVLPAGPVAWPDELREVLGWVVSVPQWAAWGEQLAGAVDAYAVAHPLVVGMPLEAARRAAGLPELGLVAAVAADAGLELSHGRVARPGVRRNLTGAESALASLESEWADAPFVAPEADRLRDLGLGPRPIAALVAEGRLLRLRDDVLLSPRAPALAMRVLVELPQPFTVSEARQAWGTTRRVAVPLLEYVDARGWTVRVDDRLRRVAGRPGLTA